MRDTITRGLEPLPGSSPHPSEKVQQPTNGNELAIAFGLAGPALTIAAGITMGSRSAVSIWA